ncbi:MAG: enoyl-CoA hydratase/isomerase family protein [Deltaproteobacteria bacterium]|nr:enoyl-CoA hydratase/isomerase family protein [Deltaproteobacteria bacterium]
MTEQPNVILHWQGAICTVTINNPEKHNILTPPCLQEIAGTFKRLGEEDSSIVVILRGAGREAFSAGADIRTMPTRTSDQSGAAPLQHDDVSTAFNAILNYPHPVIAMIHGYALGAGCMLALACDIRVASDRVQMGIPTSRMGLIPSWEEFKRFLIVLGYNSALEIFLTGKQYDGETCLAKGMINYLVEDNELETFTHKLAEEVTRCAPLSLRSAKNILTAIAENPAPSPETLAHFRMLLDQARDSDDHEEAKSAFKEKRPPVFKGR